MAPYGVDFDHFQSLCAQLEAQAGRGRVFGQTVIVRTSQDGRGSSEIQAVDRASSRHVKSLDLPREVFPLNNALQPARVQSQTSASRNVQRSSKPETQNVDPQYRRGSLDLSSVPRSSVTLSSGVTQLKRPRYKAEEADTQVIGQRRNPPRIAPNHTESAPGPSQRPSETNRDLQIPTNTPMPSDSFRPMVKPRRSLKRPNALATQIPDERGDRDSESDGSSENLAAAKVLVDELRHTPSEPHTEPAIPGRTKQRFIPTDLENGSLGFQSIRTAVVARPIPTQDQLKHAKRRWSNTKYLFTFGQLALNAFFIFGTWWWAQYYYIFLPFITITVALNDCMIFSVFIRKFWHLIRPERKNIPKSPESMVFLLPCYNETREECTRSLDSLVAQVKIEGHKTAIMIVCDGRVRGRGMAKTCGDYLMEDILINRTARYRLKNAYTAWDTHPMDIEVQTGSYKGLPYFCVVKDRNQGKRDSLILARSFLYKFNFRHQRPTTIFDPVFFDRMSSFLATDAGFTNADLLIGMDADTVFEDDCISHLLEESHYDNTVGVCGYVAVDFTGGPWSLWSLYQSSEYTISQGLRRLHQSLVTHKVSCLPGCCQLLRVCETTCGDDVLLARFGYYPRAEDGMLCQIRATASEDRNHVCLMLSARSKAQTRQALRARAYTDVPHSWSVFLSQRRRWTLGATSNDLFLVFAPGVNIFERVLAAANVITWYLNPFILASIASFIIACTLVPYWVVLSFASVMVAPLLYYICIVFWLPRTTRERVQYLMGLSIYVFLGPFLNIGVLTYALWNMDNFGWGKTRQVAKEELKSGEKAPVGAPDV